MVKTRVNLSKGFVLRNVGIVTAIEKVERVLAIDGRHKIWQYMMKSF